MANYFIPPTAPTVPMAVKGNHPGYKLFRHYRPMDAGINVFIVNGAVTTVEPDYAVVTPSAVFLGGHVHVVSDVIAGQLIAAGYTILGDPATPVEYVAPLPSSGALGTSPLGTAPLGGAA